MAVQVTVGEALSRARSALGKLGLPQAWASFYTRPHTRGPNDPNDCDFFFTWLLKDNGGRARSDYRNGSIKATRADRPWAKVVHDTPKVGDGVLLRWGRVGLPDHIGIVEKVLSGGAVQTIEANTGPRVDVFNPAGVYRRTRYPANIVGYIRPDYKEE